ncbi:MAG TPA: cupin domain-containing protein [Ramlibacter sp.]|jgi:gentisate 1,2-dioxygenase|nr:cupin domain-containing protein [Ramlibacter sp.]
MNDAHARRALQEELARFACRVHQPEDPPLFSREPRPAMQSHHWRWADLAPLLDKLGGNVELGVQGPRRTLRLATPGLESGTTTTFWASIQVILPGEVAGAHRHSASAFRFVMRGSGATTTVDGERYPMNEGDLVLTPAWTWHDHEYHGDAPMVWLDILDISLMAKMDATFFEPHASTTQAVNALADASQRKFGSGLMRPACRDEGSDANPVLVYPAAMARESLQRAADAIRDPVDDVRLEYQNPRTGGSAMRTMALSMQTLRPGFQGQRVRSTGSKLYYVVEGEGTTSIGGQDHDWSAGDFLAIAPWDWHAHRNHSRCDAVLFRVDDHPTMRALGFFREENGTASA